VKTELCSYFQNLGESLNEGYDIIRGMIWYDKQLWYNNYGPKGRKCLQWTVSDIMIVGMVDSNGIIIARTYESENMWISIPI
jgi:hypothetical protein